MANVGRPKSASRTKKIKITLPLFTEEQIAKIVEKDKRYLNKTDFIRRAIELAIELYEKEYGRV